MLRPHHLPDLDRLSVLIATILLAYVSTQFVEIPTQDLAAQLPGLYLEVQINIHTVIAVLVAGLTASGMYWLLQDHPVISGRSSLQHLFLPALTAWVLSLPLNNLADRLAWWAAFFVGGILLGLVLYAEYIVVDLDDERQPIAAAGLTAISFALFLILAISLRAEGLRLFLLLPALVFAAGLVSLRTLHLRLHGRWETRKALTIALILGHLTAAFHYWPLTPTTFGLALLGPVYALTSFLGNLAQGRQTLSALLEPALVLVLMLAIVLWMR